MGTQGQPPPEGGVARLRGGLEEATGSVLSVRTVEEGESAVQVDVPDPTSAQRGLERAVLDRDSSHVVGNPWGRYYLRPRSVGTHGMVEVRVGAGRAHGPRYGRANSSSRGHPLDPRP